ncbi:hypothetical protein [Calothrix sp. PCC 7507]|uniref:hypothetical protein n=1 Tax=Calothrix sp. PCC 7507 TaxID=99598 RepID=UPI00029EDE61|nr:hypothetical protein [Calothrix sp. PCC 7507]AFY35131.1 hypothetical protein Cal7507_4776 [Calothrix sp. PCC 7507]
MNLPNNPNFRYFAYLALLTTFLAVLAKFDGIITLQVTNLGLQVQVENHSPKCLIDSHPENIQQQQLA